MNKTIQEDPFDAEDIILYDCYINFNKLRFLKFLFLHALQFYILGPILIIWVYFYEG